MLRPARSRDRKPTPPLPGTQRAHHATTAHALSTARTPDAAGVAAHTPPQQQPQPQGSTTRTHAVLHAARTARARKAPPPEAVRPNSRHQTPLTNDDARRRKDAACPQGHKAEDADRWGKRKLGGRPGNGAPLRARGASSFRGNPKPPFLSDQHRKWSTVVLAGESVTFALLRPLSARQR